MDELKKSSKCKNEKLLLTFYFRQINQKYGKESKRCLGGKRRERKNNYEKAKPYSREYFQQNKREQK